MTGSEPQSADGWEDDDEDTLPGSAGALQIADHIADLPEHLEARNATVRLVLYKLAMSTGCPESIEQAYRLGYRAAEMAQLDRLRGDVLFRRWLGAQTLMDVALSDAALLAGIRPLLEACEAIPDITLSPWGCGSGPMFGHLRDALRAQRKAQGLDIDAPIEDFDSEGWLLARWESAPATERKEDR